RLAPRALLLVSALDAGLLQQLAMLLLSHPLAALLDDGAHGTTFGPHSTERKRARSPARRRQGQGTRPVKTTAALPGGTPQPGAGDPGGCRYCFPRIPSGQVSWRRRRHP